MKYTRNCLFPWKFIIIHAGGLMCPCCAINDDDYGDFLLDYVEPAKRGEAVADIFNNRQIQEIKKGLLSGDLRPMCQQCALASNELIPVDELKNELLDYLKKRGCSDSLNDKELSEICALERAGIGITNKCNLRCIYCNQSVLADINPYFKVDFPNDAIEDSLELLAQKGVSIIETGAFGEATIHPDWYRVFSKFHEKHPDICLYLTTNLCKKYTDDEIRLLAEHKHLRISLETLNEDLFAKIRVNGNLRLVLENIERIKAAIDSGNGKRENVAIDSVICNLTWREIPEVSSFAYENGFSYSANNYEKRPNSTGYLTGELKMIEELSSEEQEAVRRLLLEAGAKAERLELSFRTNGDIIGRTEEKYNRFIPSDDDVIYQRFIDKYQSGRKDIYLDVVYDHLHKSYAGFRIRKGGGK